MARSTYKPQQVVPTLLEIFERVIWPHLLSPQPLQLIVARPTRREFVRSNRELPAGLTHAACPLVGPRTHPRPRPTITIDTIAARWPQDKLHATRSPQLLYTVAGAADIRLGDYTVHIPEGCFCLLPPMVPRPDGTEPHLASAHRRAKPEGSNDILWLSGSEGRIDTWACHSRGDRHWIGRYTTRTSIRRHDAYLLFSTLFDEAETDSQEAQLIAHNILRVLLGIVLREFRMGRAGAKIAPPVNTAKGAWDPIAVVQDHVQARLHKRLTIEDVARIAYMAPSQFTAKFRQSTGQTFNDYLTTQRLQRAQQLLCESDCTIQHVAEVVGIHQSHLRRLFERHLQCTPMDYRRRNRA